ncbi:hypothetical protein, partial [Salmonella enterica]|uniref:hypothetical protein n=1 Tax=Salmonella enterica TaxID=28901 RepID=UPI0020C3589A
MAGALAPIVRRPALEARAGCGHILVDRPGEAAMVDDDMMGGHGGQGVGFPTAQLGLAIDAGADADMAHHDIMSRDV